MEKGSKIVVIILLATIALLLVGIMSVAIIMQGRGEKMSILAIGNKTTKIFEQTYEANEIQKIEVKAQSSRIEVVESNSPQIKVTAYGINGEKIEVKQKENRLVIEKPPVFHLFIFFAWCDEKIIVEVPKEQAKDFVLETTSGSIQIPDLPESNLEIGSTSGSIRCGDMKNGSMKTTSGSIHIGSGKELVAKSTSGKITTGTFDKAEVKTTSGGIDVGEIKEGKAESTSGRVRVQEADKLTAKTTSGGIAIQKINRFCNLSSTSGSIKVEECSLQENSSIRTKSGSVTVTKTNEFYADTNTNSGSVKVQSNNRKAEIELKIQTTSGSIRVLE